ncbi:PTS sugar transporter subunit IIA [Gilliamella sp. wkB112]|uniref:PTS sugar transporter subunit IIA n=1 Tax=Gilliamella sp. wkB112 TaxID=3120257 RepID=UPI00080EE137|nr:PTS sugar transporter subunit IIA [Gilliamella apicola]OCG02985.1 hypothetical protein A9G12_08655 [Gilliamella apicola]
MNKTKVIVITHGDLVNGLIKTCEMFAGKLSDTYGISVQPGDTIEKIAQQLEEIVINNEGVEFIICVDILGGTPFNVACLQKKKNSNIHIITGVNLPILLFLSLERDSYSTINEMKDCLMSEIQNSIKFV